MGLIVLLLIEKPKKRQQNFDRPNLQVVQQTLTLLLLFYYYYYYYYYCYFVILYCYCFYSRNKKVKQKYIFTERLFMLNDIIMDDTIIFEKYLCRSSVHEFWRNSIKKMHFGRQTKRLTDQSNTVWNRCIVRYLALFWIIFYPRYQMNDIELLLWKNTKICKSKRMDCLKACEYFEIKQQDRYCLTINYSKSVFFLKIENLLVNISNELSEKSFVK